MLLQNNIWLLGIATILAITLALGFLVNYLLRFFEKKFSSKRSIWNNLLLGTIRRPLQVLIWAMGAILVVKAICNHFEIDIKSALSIITNLVIIYCLSWFAFCLVKKYESQLSKTQGNKILGGVSISAIARALKIILIIIVLLLVMQSVGVGITGLVAFGGIGGIALGFAAKDLLANFFGATMIYFDRPFAVGDWIKSPDREIEGVVEHVGWRLTHIRTFDKRMLYIPNSIFSTLIVENPSRMTKRRINETIRLRYQDVDKVKKIIGEVREMLLWERGIDKSQNPLVNLAKFGESSVDFFVEAFTETKDWKEYSAIKQEVLLKINAIIS